ncbi:hypothetical protein LNA02_04180 [Levilactobacillus namurensis]|nr:hypothetical protein LNA02_04180 [Levilactobacillus namurensis]
MVTSSLKFLNKNKWKHFFYLEAYAYPIKKASSTGSSASKGGGQNEGK